MDRIPYLFFFIFFHFIRPRNIGILIMSLLPSEKTEHMEMEMEIVDNPCAPVLTVPAINKTDESKQDTPKKRVLVIPHQFPTLRDWIHGFDMVQCTIAACSNVQCVRAAQVKAEEAHKAAAKQEAIQVKKAAREAKKAAKPSKKRKSPTVGDATESTESKEAQDPTPAKKQRGPRTKWIVHLNSHDETREDPFRGPIGPLWPSAESATAHAIQLVWQRLLFLKHLDEGDQAYFAECIRMAPDSNKTLELINGMLVDVTDDSYVLEASVSEHEIATVPRKRKPVVYRKTSASPRMSIQSETVALH